MPAREADSISGSNIAVVPAVSVQAGHLTDQHLLLLTYISKLGCKFHNLCSFT